MTYVYQHFPKWLTLADGSQVIAQDAAHEARITEGQKSPYVNGDPREELRAHAAKLGIETDGRWSVARLQREIAEKTAPTPAQEHHT